MEQRVNLDNLVIGVSITRETSTRLGRTLACYCIAQDIYEKRPGRYIISFFTRKAWRKAQELYASERFRDVFLANLHSRAPLDLTFSLDLEYHVAGAAGALCVIAHYDPTATLEE